MPQLVIVIIVIVLYVGLMKWLFTAVAPDLLLIASLAGLAAIPITYARAAFRAFAPRGRLLGIVALIGVSVVLFFLYCDMAYIAAAAIQPLVRPRLGRDVLDLLASTVTGSPGQQQVMRWAASLVAAPGMGAAVLCGAVAKGLLLAPLLVLSRGLRSDQEGQQQPARLQYFFHQAYADLGILVQQCTGEFGQVVRAAAKGILVATVGPQGIFIWPLSLTALVALVPVTIVAACALLTLLCVHGGSMMLVAGLNLFLAAMLYCTERAVMLVRSGYAKCPHAGCHASVPLPVFLCPACGERHTRLIPGRFGLLRRVCKCDRAVLPTLFLLGKGALPSQCPRCSREMRGELFLGNAHIPIYGGPSAGKTMFMMATAWQLLEHQLGRVSASLIKETDQRSYEGRWRPAMEMGRVLDKTVESAPDAFLLGLQVRLGLPLSLYLYDPSGEALLSEEKLRDHAFLRYVDGLALIIDPLALPAMLERCQRSGGPDLQEGTSREAPAEVLHHMINEMERQGILPRGEQFRRRTAVIFSKGDIRLVQQEFGVALGSEAPAGRWAKLGQASSPKIREWLARNERNLLQILETKFAHLRFFLVSALGHAPEERRAFAPQQALEPLCWLLSGRRALSHPVAARVATRLTELAAALTMLALFLAPLAFGLRAVLASGPDPAPITVEPAVEPGASAAAHAGAPQGSQAPAPAPAAPQGGCTAAVRVAGVELPAFPAAEPLSAWLCGLGSADVASLWGRLVDQVEPHLAGATRLEPRDTRRYLTELQMETRPVLRKGRRESKGPRVVLRFGFLDGRLSRIQVEPSRADRKLRAHVQQALGRAPDEQGRDAEGAPYLLWRRERSLVLVRTVHGRASLVLAEAAAHAALEQRLAGVAEVEKLVRGSIQAFSARPAETEKALQMNREALAKFPGYGDALVNLCHAHYDLGQLDEALEQCQKAEEVTAEAAVRAEARYYRALVAAAREQRDEAVVLLGQAQAELPKRSLLRKALRQRQRGLSGTRDVAVTRAALHDHLCYATRGVPERSAAIAREYGFETVDVLRGWASELGINSEEVAAEVRAACTPEEGSP